MSQREFTIVIDTELATPRTWRSHDRAQDGFTIVGIVTDVHARERIRAFLAEHDITYATLLASPGVIRDYGGISSLPESFLLDRNGRIRHRVIGFFAEPALRAAVDRMLEEIVE